MPLDVPVSWRRSILAALVRCFDYSRPTPRLDIALTRALTCVLLDTVAQSQKPQQQQQQRREENFVPTTPCQALGMKPEEYRYLVRSAF